MMASSILMMRTVANGGLLAMQYFEFFSMNPQTNYTHINVVNALTGAYPYPGTGLGHVIGRYFYGYEMNANASFWATDGIAAAGLYGVLLATVGCSLVFVALNTFTRRYEPLYVVLCLLPFSVSLLNTSLFSSLWSGGALLLLVFFMIDRGRRCVTVDS
jgi:hypothetical protein